MTNYVRKIVKLLDEELRMPVEYIELLDVYSLLVLTVGEKCTKRNVHDAWSIWQNKIMPDHKSLIPFEELTGEIQNLDEQYRVAIVKVAHGLNGLNK